MGRCPSMAGGPLHAFCFVVVVVIVVQLSSAATPEIRFAQVPSNLTVADTAPLVLRCAATPLSNTPTGSVRYKWEKDGAPYANTQWIHLTSASSGDAGWYVCVAIYGSRAIRSEPALVKVTARRDVPATNGTLDGSVVAIAVAVPLSLLGLILLAVIVVSVTVVVCARRGKRPSGGPAESNQRRLEGQTSEETSLLAPSNTMSLEGIKQVPAAPGDGDVDKGASDGEGDSGAGVGAEQSSKDNHSDLDDLQLDVTMFEDTVHAGAFSAENLTTLTEVTHPLQRSPRITNLSHIRPPKVSNSDMFQASNLPRTNDAINRVFHSLISIPAAGVSEAMASGGTLHLNTPMASRDRRRVSVPASISESSHTDVQVTHGMKNIHQKFGPDEESREASVEPCTSDIEPCEVNVEPLATIAGVWSATTVSPLMESNAAVKSHAGIKELYSAGTECQADEMKSGTVDSAPLAMSSVEEKKTDHHTEPVVAHPLTVQGEKQQLHSKVSDLRQRFLPGPVEIPPNLTTATSQRLQRSKLIIQKAHQVFSQLPGPDGAQVATGLREAISTVPDPVAVETASSRGQEQAMVPNKDTHIALRNVDPVSSHTEVVANCQVLMEEVRPSLIPPVALRSTDDGRADHSRGACIEPYTRGFVEPPSEGHTKTSSGGHMESSIGGGIEHAEPLQGGREESPRGGLVESSRELSVPPTRPHPVSPVFARHVSKSTSPRLHRPSSNLLVSMSAGSPASTGQTPPPVRRMNSPNSSKSCASSRHGDAGDNLSLPSTSHGSGVLLEVDGGGVSSSRGDEDAWSISSDEELIAPLAMAPPPAKRVDSTEDPFSHHHPHRDTTLSPKVKDCVSQMSKSVHTQPLFSEPKKVHSRRQRKKLSIIPEDSPTVSS